MLVLRVDAGRRRKAGRRFFTILVGVSRLKHTSIQPIETVVDVTCDACGKSTRVDGGGLEFGVLQAFWGYGSKHDGERYEIHLCEGCFFSALSHILRDNALNNLFDDLPGEKSEN